MKITVEARHIDIEDEIREYAETKVGKLPRYYDQIKAVDVILDSEAGLFTGEIIAHVSKKPPFIATHEDEDIRACIDLCMDKISQQLRRYKEKLRDHKGPDGH